MGEEALPLRRQADPAVGAHKQLAAELALEQIHAAGEIRLVVPKNLSSFGKALILCNIVKNAVVIQRHDPCLLLHSLIYDIDISNI